MKTATATLLVLSLFLPAYAIYASDTQVRTHRADIDGITDITFEGGVGEMTIVRATGSELLVELEIESERNWRGKRRNISDIDVVMDRRGDRLHVSLNEDDMDNLELNWRIALPDVARTTVNLGVGQLIAETGDTDLRVELGVGDARIGIPRQHTGRIDASVGVGSVHMDGARDTVSKRAFVSESVYGYGDGIRDAQVEVGVGEVSVVLNES